MFDTPILFLVFNRPELTRQVFERIRAVKPKLLFVAADGARLNREGENEKCKLAREYATAIDWDCQLYTLFRDKNLGCGRAVSEAITWFFENVEQGIILEDDCLPSNDFFTFCEDILDKYKDDERIMMVSGTNLLGEWKSDRQSYHFSYYGSIWGWASWRRAWKYYDFEMKLWGNDEIRERIKDVLVTDAQYKARSEIYSKYFNNEGEDSWDYQWSFSRLAQSGLSIVPAVNLISNIGFGIEATHTMDRESLLANLKIRFFMQPLRYNQFVIVDRSFDQVVMMKQGVFELNHINSSRLIAFIHSLRPRLFHYLKTHIAFLFR